MFPAADNSAKTDFNFESETQKRRGQKKGGEISQLM